jgi:lipopolysaccharide biosynthesis regulator YciM
VTELLNEPWFLKTLAGLILFFSVVVLSRRLRRVARELERRKALADYVRGLDEFLRGDYRSGIETLERVLERDPENVEARIALGDCYREIGDPAEAKKHHHHVHKVFGNELARNFLSLGKDELALGHYDLAVEAFDKSLELQPRERDTIWAMALAYAEGGNAIAAADSIRSLHPDGPHPDLTLSQRRQAARMLCDAARALLEENQPEQAIRFYTEALAFRPSSLRARAGLLRAAHALGDDARAKELVQQHLVELQDLARNEDVLFEPVAAPEFEEKKQEPSGRHLPARIEDLGGLVVAVEERTARYVCNECGNLSRDYAAVCAFCDAVGTLESLPQLRAAYTMPLKDHAGAADELEESAAYVQALAQKASLGDEEALDKLLAVGPNALYEVFAGLQAIEARRYLGSRMAALGAEAAREVQACLTANPGRLQEEFAAGFYLALSDQADLSDTALAGILADPRLDETLRDRAQALLARRRNTPIPALVDAVAASADPDAARRAAELISRDHVGELERRYLQAKLLGKLFGARQGRRRAAADILAATRLPEAVAALQRAAAREKDEALRSHYTAAKARAEQAS